MEKLEGENRIEEFRRIANDLTSRMRSLDGVVGVIAMGGLTRGFADKYSDIDMIVLLGRRNEKLTDKIKKIRIDEQKVSKVDMDVEIHNIKDFITEKIDEYRKWDLSHSTIVYDLDGKTRDALKKKTQISKNFWMDRTVVLGEHLKWYCCPPTKEVQSVIEAWIARGDMISAHYSMNYALDLIIKMLFTLNRELLPAPKWRIFYSYALKWLPADYRKLVEEALMVSSLSASDLNRRLSAIKEMWLRILPKLKNEMGLTSDLISKMYVKKMLHQK